MNHEQAPGNIGGHKNKLTLKRKLQRTGVAILIAATGATLVNDFGHDLLSGGGNSSVPAVDTGNNELVLAAPGLNETLIAEPNSHEKGQVVKVTWGSDTLSNFAKDLIIANPSAGKSTAEKVLAGQDQAMMVTNTLESQGGINDGDSNVMKIPLDTSLTTLNLEEQQQQTGTEIKLVK